MPVAGRSVQPGVPPVSTRAPPADTLDADIALIGSPTNVAYADYVGKAVRSIEKPSAKR
jgi:hypothetical protein